MDRYNPTIEAQAKLAYDLMEYDGPGEKPAWVDHGNSEKQDDARRIAIVELEERGIDFSQVEPMKAIPIAAAKRIAEEFGYDQVIIYARRVGEDPAPHGEHLTTYGRTPALCDAAGRMSATLQEFMGWHDAEEVAG